MTQPATEIRVAIVLGAAVRPNGTASPALALRAHHAAALWHSGRVTHVCTTGAAGSHGPPEALVARDLLGARGPLDDALLTETASTNTVENIAQATALLPDGARVVLVSNRWHLPRAWAIARLMGRSTTLSGPRGTAPPAATMLAILREAAAFPVSALRALRSRR